MKETVRALLALVKIGDHKHAPTSRVCLRVAPQNRPLNWPEIHDSFFQQFNIKLRGDQYTLEKLRKRMRKLLGPDIWKEFANESELIEAGEELVNLQNDP